MAMQVNNPANALHRNVVRAYTTPGHPVAFSAPQTVAKHFNISPERARKILEHIDTYTLHREYKKPSVYNPYYVYHRREQVQADLIDIQKIARHNDGVKYLLLFIDIFTKFIWLYPMVRKTTQECVRIFNLWLRQVRRKPKLLLTDQGREFTNRSIQTLLRRKRIEWQPAVGTCKAAIAERANKTIQVLIYKFLSERESLRYIDDLARLVNTYNKRPHRTLDGMTPKEADRPANEQRVRAIHMARYAKIEQKKKASKFKLGDIVRVKTESKAVSSSRRAYAEQFKGEHFRIMRVNRTMPIPMYYLRSVDTGDHIAGAFYSQELQLVQGDVYKIERVIRRRVRRGVREVYVKWKYFGPQWNEWIPEANIVRVF